MEKITVKVGMASCGIAAGAVPVLAALQKSLSGRSDVEIKEVGCLGLCFHEPLVEIDQGGKRTVYGEVTPEIAERIVSEHIDGGKIIEERAILSSEIDACENRMVDRQVRVVLRNSGHIDPTRIEEYVARQGYEALKKALTSMTPEQVIEEVLASGLRGRGGAGFPTGLKWKFARASKGDDKYVVCNADEGDPGAFMDRSVLEGDPHSIIEGMALCGYAIGSTHGIIYCRAEYPLAIKNLSIALDQAREKNLLGKNIMGLGFDFDIYIKEGAGAFVCGEETALMASIEGKRGMPRPRPPFPANRGVYDKPTNINNVETLANIAWIITNGGSAFAAYGTEKSKGSKVFALAGKISKGGLVEVPMGMPIREVIFDVGGGIPNGKKFKAVQTGGPSGGCLTEKHLDVPIDFDNLIAAGSMMGSGGMIVMDEDNCMVSIAKFFLEFTVEESCGKCAPCRIGNKRLHELLTKITKGNGTMADLDRLKNMCLVIKDTSLCGLGQSSPNPVLSTLTNFMDEYVAHVKDKKCPAGQCRDLMKYSIVVDKCVGCTACARACPVNAISGERKGPHFIDQEKCIKCGACFEKCKFNAVLIS